MPHTAYLDTRNTCLHVLHRMLLGDALQCSLGTLLGAVWRYIVWRARSRYVDATQLIVLNKRSKTME